MKAEKCKFHLSNVKFLDYVIGAAGVTIDCEKVSAVTNGPSATSVKELQWFLGFANFYRCLIQGFSTSVAPLTGLSSLHC